jgi:hypothetical protein
MHAGHRSIQLSRFWNKAIVFGSHLLFLLPVPVFASYTLGTWTQVGGPSWNPVGTSGVFGNDLALSPAPGINIGFPPPPPVEIDFTALVTVTGTSTNVNASTSNFAAFSVSAFSGTGGVTVTIGFAPNGSPTNPDRIISSNQFNGGPLSDILPGVGQTIVTGDYAVVKFVFTSQSDWYPTSVSSTPIHITFTPGN